jgi:tetratricopeptide (TPR) repeat protein
MKSPVKLPDALLREWQNARDLVKDKKRDSARNAFHQLVKKAPGHPQVLFEAARAAYEAGDLQDAANLFRKSARLAAKDAKLLGKVGDSLLKMRIMDEGIACLRRSLAMDSSAVSVIRQLVRTYERIGQAEEARAVLDPYLQQSPTDLTALYLHALLLQRGGQLDAAENVLQELVRRPVEASRIYLSSFYLLAGILDQTGRHEEAMKLLLHVKSLVLANPDFQTSLAHYDQGVAQRNRLMEMFTTDMIREWQNAEPFHADDRKLAFLGGHPRSGTTLLERVLDSHPDLTAFDEPISFYRTVDPFLRRYGPDHPDLKDVSTRYRQHMLWEMGGTCASTVWLDKNPSLTACLHTWLRVFPGLKVVIALRHPMDVMLSCFFLDSSMNSLSSNFLSLERISKHYRDMMDVWLRLRDLGGFQWIESRYEDTVTDLAAEGRRVTEFLGLEWQDQQADFHQRKQQTAVVAPTYHDVTKPVHQRSMQRWLAYESYLAPHRKELEPYMKRLGYA